MRILQIIPSLQTGGAEKLTLDICNHLANHQGVEVLLLTLSKNTTLVIPDNIQMGICNSYVRPSVFGKWDVDISELEKTISTFKPDIIHSHLFEAEMLSRYNLHPQIAYFTHLHSNYPQFDKSKLSALTSKPKLTNLFERSFLMKHYKQCDNNFITISNDNFKFVRQNIPASLKNQVHLLPNAIDVAKYRCKLPREIGTPVKLISVGSLYPVKNHVFLVRVVKELINNGIDAALTILGEGSQRNNILALARELDIQDKIILQGNVNNVSSFLQNADIYVHSAVTEGFGLTTIEAMAAGLPCIAIDAGGNRDTIKSGENGYLVQSGNTSDFVGKITGLIKDKNTYCRLSENAIKSANKYDIAPYISNLLELYRSKLK